MMCGKCVALFILRHHIFRLKSAQREMTHTDVLFVFLYFAGEETQFV